MQITHQNNNFKQSFQGYGARPIEALVIRNSKGYPSLFGITKELMEIGDKHNFKVISEGKNLLERLPERDVFQRNRSKQNVWTQDVVCAFEDKVLYKGKQSPKKIHDMLNRRAVGVPQSKYIAGGNMFLLDENKTLLIGANENIANAASLFHPERIVTLPQVDFHIDLFVRPLKDNVVLVADDKMTIDALVSARDTVRKYDKMKDKSQILSKLNSTIYQMEFARKQKYGGDTEKVIKRLEEKGFKPVRVPGRIIEPHRDCPDSLSNRMNFMNAIVHQDENGDLIYITNKSDILSDLGISKKLAKHLGINFESVFKDKVKDYIKPENIYYIRGDKNESSISSIMSNLMGGIHCLCAEIPKKN